MGAQPPPAAEQRQGHGHEGQAPRREAGVCAGHLRHRRDHQPGSTVSALHALGKHVVCYVEVGAAGNYYTAAEEGIPVTYYDQLKAAGAFGGKVPGYPEYYLDIRSPQTVSIIESMIATQCAAKGFDAVETDIDEEYNDNSGFPLTRSIQESYMTTLADYMHGLGLGWWIKNPDDTGDRYATDMEPLADAVLTEQCNQYSSCALLSVYVGHKAVFNAEYRLRPSSFCGNDDALRFNGPASPWPSPGPGSPAPSQRVARGPEGGPAGPAVQPPVQLTRTSGRGRPSASHRA